MSESTAQRYSGPSLSPSRAGDFKSCPLLYRFRTIDRLPEAPSPAATRGTLVHAVLERLYDLPAAERTVQAALELLVPEWEKLRVDEPGLDALFGDDAEREVWLHSSHKLLHTYFELEDPTRLEPAEREQRVETIIGDGLQLRGYVDRLDVAPTGQIRVVDYKTGASPREAFEGKALFQLKFYALILWRTRGVVPSQLKLLYLSDGDALTYAPGEDELTRFERTLLALWSAIDRATKARDFRPNKGPLCKWCDHRPICPAHGGTAPPWPEKAAPEGDPTTGAVDESAPQS